MDLPDLARVLSQLGANQPSLDRYTLAGSSSDGELIKLAGHVLFAELNRANRVHSLPNK